MAEFDPNKVTRLYDEHKKLAKASNQAETRALTLAGFRLHNEWDKLHDHQPARSDEFIREAAQVNSEERMAAAVALQSQVERAAQYKDAHLDAMIGHAAVLAAEAGVELGIETSPQTAEGEVQ